MPVEESPGEWTIQVRRRVRAVIAEHEITATEIARRAGWSQSYIAHRLSPKAGYALSVADLETIAQVLGLAPNELIPARREVAA